MAKVLVYANRADKLAELVSFARTLGSECLALACGPMPFLRFIWRYALEIGLRTQLSLEQRMACGVGACLGCVTVTSQHWADAEKAGLPVQTCTSGPVFWATDVDLDADIAQGGAS